MILKKALKQFWNFLFGRLEKEFISELNRLVGSSCASLLDVGCGFNSPVQHLIHRPSYLVGIDGFLPVIEQSQIKKLHDKYYHSQLLN